MSKDNGKTVNRRSKPNNAPKRAKEAEKDGSLSAKITKVYEKRRFNPFGNLRKAKKKKK